MQLRYKIGLFVVGILGCTALLQRCNRPGKFKGPSQISYKGDTIVVKQKGKKTFTEYQPDPKSTVITTDKHGNVTVKIRQFGVGTDLGVGLGYERVARVALDDRFAYYKRFGANVGLGVSLDKTDYTKGHLLDIAAPYIGVSYVPYLTFANVSVIGAYTATKHIFVFVRVRL
jgi:hypothetical protein